MALRRCVPLLLVVLAAAAASASAGPGVQTVEDWHGFAVGTRGVPAGWRAEGLGRRSELDLEIVQDDGQPALRLRSADERSTITKDIRGQVSLAATPVLEWRWKVLTLPRGGDARHRATSDHAAQVYVVWPRFPEMLRSRLIGYVWDTTVPAGTVLRSPKTPTVTFVVVRSGPAELGRWLVERRDVAADYRRIYGEAPEAPAAVSLSIDSNDTHTTAEALVGAIAFQPPARSAGH